MKANRWSPETEDGRLTAKEHEKGDKLYRFAWDYPGKLFSSGHTGILGHSRLHTETFLG